MRDDVDRLAEIVDRLAAANVEVAGALRDTLVEVRKMAEVVNTLRSEVDTLKVSNRQKSTLLAWHAEQLAHLEAVVGTTLPRP